MTSTQFLSVFLSAIATVVAYCLGYSSGNQRGYIKGSEDGYLQAKGLFDAAIDKIKKDSSKAYDEAIAESNAKYDALVKDVERRLS